MECVANVPWNVSLDKTIVYRINLYGYSILYVYEQNSNRKQFESPFIEAIEIEHFILLVFCFGISYEVIVWFRSVV